MKQEDGLLSSPDRIFLSHINTNVFFLIIKTCRNASTFKFLKEKIFRIRNAQTYQTLILAPILLVDCHSTVSA